jgi:hypothetical protein
MEKTLKKNVMEENRDEQNNQRTNEDEETKIYLTPGSSLQTPEEDRRDKSTDSGRDENISVSRDDLHETNADKYTGSDRACTAERKDNQLRTE